jgi:hypothetical protein
MLGGCMSRGPSGSTTPSREEVGMRLHEWTFLAVPEVGAGKGTSGVVVARVVGVCVACGLMRSAPVRAGEDRWFDLSGDCRTGPERAEDERVSHAGGG